MSSCAPAQQVSTAERTQAAATALAHANAILTSTFAARTPHARTPAPTPLPFGFGIQPGSGSDTPPVVPITGATATAAAVCNHPMTMLTPGPKALVLINNNRTDASILFRMGLSEPNFLGDCGFITKAGIPPGKSTTVSVPWSDPIGGSCYWAYAVIAGPKHTSTTVSDGGFCLANASKWMLNVTNHGIRLIAS